ncbi:MAG: hypothetical protein GX811_13950, partial [Lentisphaerae bacterium]|nr:hypothetical protein [Lentisphaerota bacterium]
MKISICHYSYHRRWANEKWDAIRLAEEVKALGADAVDFHAGMLADPDAAPELILTALEKTGVELSGLSMSNNFSDKDPDKRRAQIDNVK